MDFDLDNAKIKKPTVHELVYEQMKNAIINRHWNVGDRLPSEQVLAQKFGVNRLSVRLALQKLNALGVIETRIGDGTYVKEFDINQYFQEVFLFFMRPELLDDVSDFRKSIEVDCCRLAIQKATKEELAELEAACKAYGKQCQIVEKNYTEETLAELAKKDMLFHYKICEISHNELYINSYAMAKEIIYQYLLIILRKRIENWKVKNENKVDDKRHYNIYRAIKTKDFEKCKTILLETVDHNVEL